MSNRRNRSDASEQIVQDAPTWPMRRPWLAVALWLVLLVGLQAAAAVLGSAFHDDHTLPGTESQTVADRLEAYGGDQAGMTLVLHGPAGSVLADPGLDELFDDIAQLPGVQSVAPPAAEEGTVSEDGRTAYATVTMTDPPDQVDPDRVRAVIDAGEAAQTADLQVAVGGDPTRGLAEEEGPPAEMIGLLAALVILVLLFGSLLAAALPIVCAVFAVSSAIGAATLVSHLGDLPTYAAPMMMLVGLGVGIDYALLVFSRFRQEILAGADRGSAMLTARRTAGRSVLIAGVIVIVALLGLVVLGLGSLRGLAIAVAVTVAGTALASMTLLPALLTLWGPRIERKIRRRAEHRRHGDRMRRPGDRWRRIADVVVRHPWPALLGGLTILVLLAAPAADIRLGFADASTDPEDTSSREAYDLMSRGFGPGHAGSLIILADAPEAEIETAAEAMRDVPDVASVTGPVPVDDDRVRLLIVTPETAPSDARTAELVHTLRDDVLAPLRAGDVTFLVGGSTAAAIDFSEAVAERLPWFVLIVVGVSTVLLAVVFSSLVVPVKAAAANLLSIGAALGAMQLVYGHGWFGVTPGPIEAFLPVIVFAVVFGLSMDYEVFLMSRMREEWLRSGDAIHAVREGLATTGTVITAAAAIMIVVFGAFVLSPTRMLGQMGLGLAVAVFVDAVIVRCLLVPAVMRLAGDRAWWAPAWWPRRRAPSPRAGLEQIG